MKTLLDFDHKKSVQALNYLAMKEGGTINKMKAIKLIWLADRSHLRRFGRPITNDTYFAMTWGPVGSSTKDMAQCSSISKEEERYATKYLGCDPKRLHVKSVRNPDADVFSDAEIETLDHVYSVFGDWSEFKLAKFSHAFPEWKKFEAAITSKQVTREVMTYHDFFGNPAGALSINAFFTEAPEVIEAAKGEFEQNYKVASFWQ